MTDESIKNMMRQLICEILSETLTELSETITREEMNHIDSAEFLQKVADAYSAEASVITLMEQINNPNLNQ